MIFLYKDLVEVESKNNNEHLHIKIKCIFKTLKLNKCKFVHYSIQLSK